MSFVKTKGIVLREIKTGDADKLLVFLTQEYGKITVLAPGARRTRSKFVGCTQWLCYSEIYLYKTKENYRLNDGSIIEPFYNIRDDLDKLYIASFFCDVIKDVVMQNVYAKQELRLLLNSLYYISRGQKDVGLVVSVFRIRILLSSGMAPLVDECTVCSSSFEAIETKEYFFDFNRCGIVCGHCAKEMGREEESKGDEKRKNNRDDLIKILPGTFFLIRHIVKARLDDLFGFDVSAEVKNQVDMVSEKFLNERLEKEYKIGG